MKTWKAEQYKDWRGVIVNCTPMNPTLKNVMYITGLKGAVRGNHVHAKDTHYSTVIAGKIKYEYQRGIDGVLCEVILHPGDIVLSDVGELHRFTFLEDGAFIACATEARDHDSYEHDTKRVNF